jgi:hypothetical protein
MAAMALIGPTSNTMSRAGYLMLGAQAGLRSACLMLREPSRRHQSSFR